MYDSIVNINWLLSGGLVVGNHDSISLLGMMEQQEIEQVSKSMCDILLNQNYDIESKIDLIANTLDDILAHIRNVIEFSLCNKNDLKSCFECVDVYIGDMKLILQLQQLQILKEISLFQQLEDRICFNMDCLKKRIDEAEKILLLKENIYDFGDWYERLERRINDLKITYMLYFQTEAQLQLLKNNDIELNKRISNLFEELLPIWEIQKIQVDLIITQNDSVISEFIDSSKKLNEALGILSESEYRDKDIRFELENILKKQEI